MDKDIIVFVDVDEVCANLMKKWIGEYNRDYNDNLDYRTITEWSLTKFVKCGDEVYKYLHIPGLYHNVEPIPGALRGVDALREMGLRVVFATSTTYDLAGEKYRWLVEHGFLAPSKIIGGMSRNYIEISDKSLLRGEFLVDDGIHNIENFYGYRILFDAPHNRKETGPFRRAMDWIQVVDFVKDTLDGPEN